MNLSSLSYGLGSIGLFSTRVFLPAFLTALLLRFGHDVPILARTGLLNHLGHAPAWFTSDLSITVLGMLSALEMFGQKNPEIRRLMQELDTYLKPALAALTTFGVIKASDASFVRGTVHADISDALIVLVSAIGTWRAAGLRKTVMLSVFDHLDGTNLDRLISWLEELWVAFGLLLLFIFPLLMLATLLVALGVMLLIRKRLAVLEEKTKAPCAHCGTLIYACAISCPSCREALSQPLAVGFLGQTKPYPTQDPASHPYRLFEKRRCPVCATRLATSKLFQPCPACGTVALSDERFVQAYLDYIAMRVPLVLSVSFLMSLVPVLGLIVGVIFYRIELVLPFSQYLPTGKKFLIRLGIGLLFLLLVLLQLTPLLGGLVVPLLALISYAVYRNSFQTMVQAGRQQLPQPR